MVHKLKIYPQYFKDVALGLKKAEVRINDRDFQEYDTLILSEYDPLTDNFTGESVIRIVNYIIKDVPGLDSKYVILQIEKPL